MPLAPPLSEEVWRRASDVDSKQRVTIPPAPPTHTHPMPLPLTLEALADGQARDVDQLPLLEHLADGQLLAGLEGLDRAALLELRAAIGAAIVSGPGRGGGCGVRAGPRRAP
jgi:hypothetical protein